jgi:hypothetical protein
MNMKRKLVFLLLIFVLSGGAVFAANLGETVIKTVAIGAVVQAVAKPADKAINSLLGNRNLPIGTATKVVPALSVGEKGYVGMMQVAGSKTLVDKTKAVLQYETSFDNKQYRIKLLMPVDSVNPLGAKRVRGLGVSALLDTALSSNSYRLPPSESFRAGDALKAAAIAVAVNEFGPQLNKFINSVFKNQGGLPEGATKVVPYLSFGSKAYIGMMQVAGPSSQVSKVKAVWQFEQLFDAGRVRLRVLVPSDSVNPLAIHRVKGVGCTAVIDAMVLRAKEQKRNRQHYRYFESSPLFIGPGEDPHYRPPGWDKGRKTGWGNSPVPPGLSKKTAPKVIIIEDKDKPEKPRGKRGKGKD